MQGISNHTCWKSFEYRFLPFTFISTLPPYLMKKCIYFDTYLAPCTKVCSFLSLHTIAYLSCMREGSSSSLLAFNISSRLFCQDSWKKRNPQTQDWISNVFIITRRIIYVFSSHFNRRIQLVCFVLCNLLMYVRCWLKCVVCSSIVIWKDSECFEWTLCQREEHYAIGKQKIIRWKP